VEAAVAAPLQPWEALAQPSDGPAFPKGQGETIALTQPSGGRPSPKGPAEQASAGFAPRSKRRKKTREASPLGRLIGVLVSGLLGLACAYGIACWIGGPKNDMFHVFYKTPPAVHPAPAVKHIGPR
jgi:hypothetical protein